MMRRVSVIGLYLLILLAVRCRASSLPHSLTTDLHTKCDIEDRQPDRVDRWPTFFDGNKFGKLGWKQSRAWID